MRTPTVDHRAVEPSSAGAFGEIRNPPLQPEQNGDEIRNPPLAPPDRVGYGEARSDGSFGPPGGAP
jgi:hypothetical protein